MLYSLLREYIKYQDSPLEFDPAFSRRRARSSMICKPLSRSPLWKYVSPDFTPQPNSDGGSLRHCSSKYVEIIPMAFPKNCGLHFRYRFQNIYRSFGLTETHVQSARPCPEPNASLALFSVDFHSLRDHDHLRLDGLLVLFCDCKSTDKGALDKVYLLKVTSLTHLTEVHGVRFLIHQGGSSLLR